MPHVSIKWLPRSCGISGGTFIWCLANYAILSMNSVSTWYKFYIHHWCATYNVWLYWEPAVCGCSQIKYQVGDFRFHELCEMFISLNYFSGLWDFWQINCKAYMMTSSNGNIFQVTGPLCGEFTGHRWVPHTKASDVELWCFLWSVPE